MQTLSAIGAVGEMRMAKVGERRIAVIRTASGVHALDNACPHQGYGLVTGALDGELLTCQWHNWKFRVDTGECVIGEEDVACHPVTIERGEIAYAALYIGLSVVACIGAFVAGLKLLHWILA